MSTPTPPHLIKSSQRLINLSKMTDPHSEKLGLPSHRVAVLPTTGVGQRRKPTGRTFHLLGQGWALPVTLLSLPVRLSWGPEEGEGSRGPGRT